MFGLDVFLQLVKSVVFDITSWTLVWLVLGMSSLMIILVANSSEGPWTELAFVRLFTCVNAHVHEEVASFVERPPTPHALEKAEVRAFHVHVVDHATCKGALMALLRHALRVLQRQLLSLRRVVAT